MAGLRARFDQAATGSRSRDLARARYTQDLMQADPTGSRYWDRVASEKTFSHPIDAELLRPRIPAEARILDLGCGYGRTLAELADLGYRDAVGVDTSAGMIARGRSQFPDLDLRTVEPGPLPFEAERFDLVLLFAVLTSTTNNTAQQALVAELGRVLSPGGSIYVSDLWIQADPRNTSRYAAAQQSLSPDSTEPYGVFETADGGRFRHHTRKWIQSLFKTFDGIAAQDQAFTTMNGNRAQGFQHLYRKARRPSLPD